MKVADTSVLIDLLRGEKEIEKKILTGEEELYTCFPIKCELYRGTELARKTKEGKKEVTRLLEELHTLEADTESAEKVGELKNKYPDTNSFDLMIAGICISHNAKLLTRDRDFQKITELESTIV